MQSLIEKSLSTPFLELAYKHFYASVRYRKKDTPLANSECPQEHHDLLRKNTKNYFTSMFEEKINNLLRELGLTSNKKIMQLAKCMNPKDYEHLGEELAIAFLNPTQQDNALFDTVTCFLNCIKHHIHEKTKMLDSRKHHEEDQVVRRMDALARLLKLQDSISACTAVALVNNTLYIALNNTGKEFNPNDVIETINNRLDALIHSPFLSHLDKDMTYHSFYEEHADAILKTYFHETLPKHRLAQDLTKLIYSLHTKDHQVKELSPLVSGNLERVFLYPDKQEGILHYVAYNHTKKQGCSIPILNAPNHINKSNIHAEQILADYLLNYQSLESDYVIKLGLSKLCCTTCYECLSHYQQIKVRGTHGVTYENTYNLITNDVAKSDGIPNRRHVHPQQSPTASPMKETHEKENIPIPTNQKNKEPLISDSKQAFFKEASNEKEPQRRTNRQLFY